MKMSKHAEGRCQMRGIPYDCQEIILRHGTPIQRPGGATGFHMTKKACRAAVADCHWLLKNLERASDGTVIVADDGTCITAYKTKKVTRK